MSTAVSERRRAIEPHVLYSLEEALSCLGWKMHAYRTARRQGLKVLSAGRKTYIHGRDIIAYIEAQGSGE